MIGLALAAGLAAGVSAQAPAFAGIEMVSLPTTPTLSAGYQ